MSRTPYLNLTRPAPQDVVVEMVTELAHTLDSIDEWAQEHQGGGVSGGSAFVFEQPTAVVSWTIAHNLGYRPAGIYVEDSAHTQHEPSVDHVDINNLILSFAHPTDGFASLS